MRPVSGSPISCRPGPAIRPSRRLLVVVDDATEFADTSGAMAFEQVVRRGRDFGVHVIASGEPRAVASQYAGLGRASCARTVPASCSNPNSEVDGDLLGARLPRYQAAAFPSGRGYLVSGGMLSRLVHVAR